MSDNTREKAVEAVARIIANAACDWVDSCDDDGHPLGHSNWETYREDALAAFDAAGWSPSPVPMVDRDRLVGAVAGSECDWRDATPEGVADAILASNILRPLPTEEEIAEVLYDCWNFGSSEVPWMGVDARRELATAVLALLKGES